MHDISLQPGRDYYVDEAGRLVFTAQYHLARGYCCDNGCRHCPYHDDACHDHAARTSTHRLPDRRDG